MIFLSHNLLYLDAYMLPKTGFLSFSVVRNGCCQCCSLSPQLDMHKAWLESVF